MRRIWLSVICICLFVVLVSVVPAMSDHAPTSVEEPVHALGEIVVVAEKLSEYVKNHPQRVSTLDQKEIEERNFLDLNEAVGSMPGVDVSQSAGGLGSRISIRGSGGSGSVLVLVNGRPVNSGQYGGIDLSTIPIEIIEKITVFKPPVPVWLGPESTAGAINIVMRTSRPTDSKEEKKRKTRLRMSGGSYGRADVNCSHVMSLDNGSFMVTAGGGHKDGKRANTDKDTANVSVHWDREQDNLVKYDINGRYYYSEHGTSGPVDNPTPDARQYYNKGALDFRAKGPMGDTGAFSIKSYFDTAHLKDKSQFDYTSTLETYKIGIKGDGNWSEETGKWALRLGGMFEEDIVDHSLTGDHHREKTSINTQFDRDLGDVTLSLGLRGDHTNDFGFFPAFSIGLGYAIGPDSILKTNAGYSVNVPTFGQLYQPSHGAIDQVRGNPDLSEEEVYSYDFGLEHKFSPDFIVETVLFRADTQDLISYRRDPEELFYQPVNISRAYKQGVEISFKYKWKKDASLDLSYIFQKSKDKETDGVLIYTPRHKAKITGKYVLATGTRLEVILRAVSDQYSDSENSDSKKLDDYMNVDLKMIQPLTLKSLPGEFFIHIQNLFDTDFEFHQGYPDDGIRFVSGLNLNF
jgi:vitamin B12 transporter